MFTFGIQIYYSSQSLQNGIRCKTESFIFALWVWAGHKLSCRHEFQRTWPFPSSSCCLFQSPRWGCGWRGQSSRILLSLSHPGEATLSLSISSHWKYDWEDGKIQKRMLIWGGALSPVDRPPASALWTPGGSSDWRHQGWSRSSPWQDWSHNCLTWHQIWSLIFIFIISTV